MTMFIKAIALFLYTIKVTRLFAKRWFSKSPLPTAWGLIMVYAILSTLGAIVYFLYAWNVIALLGVLFFVAALPLIIGGAGGGLLPNVTPQDDTSINLSNASPWHWIYCLVMGGFIFKLIQSGTTRALRTPLEAIPLYSLFIILLLAELLIFHLLSNRRDTAPIIGTTLLLTVGFSLAAFLVPLGFGFDPFIHRTAEEHIALHGFITPKTPYYIGAYIIPVTLSFVSSPAMIDLTDRFFIPFLTVFTLIVSTLTLKNSTKKGALLGALLVLFLPLSSLTITTPHALTLLISILAIVSTLSHQNQLPRWILVAFALVTHAYVGVPLALFVALLSLPATKFRSTFTVFLLAGLVLAPAILLSCVSTCSLPHSFAIPTLPVSTTLRVPWNVTYDIMYGVLAIQSIALLVFIGLGLRTIFKIDRHLTYRFILGVCALVIASGFVAGQTIPGIIDYESGAFANRLLEIMLVFCVPLLIFAGDQIQTSISKTHLSIRITSTVVLSLMVTAGIFQLYPHHNAVEISRFYSVSANDYHVVQAIATDAGSTSYAVLAPQPTSAAALRTLGFTHYLQTTEHTQQFIYPIPTGGKLYSFYLDLVNTAMSREIVQTAKTYMQVDQMYVVIPPYWNDASRLQADLKTMADRYWIDEGTVIGVVH